MFDPVLTWAARKYQAAVATELKKYGLRYEDLYDPQLNMVSFSIALRFILLMRLSCLSYFEESWNSGCRSNNAA